MNFTPFGIIKDQEIANFEKTIGFVLPSDYRDFLISTNGCLFEEYFVFIPKLNQRILLDVLFGINLDKGLSLEFYHQQYLGELPSKSFIFGSDPGGGKFLLCTKGWKKGIYFYDHSHFFKSSNHKRNTYYICKDFTEFLSRIKKFEW